MSNKEAEQLNLSLAEKLVLVAFDSKKGRPTAGPSALGYGLAGAVTMDLVLRDAATLREGKLEADSETGDPILDDALARIRAGRRLRDIKYWVNVLAGRSVRLQSRLLRRLVEQGILASRSRRLLGIIPIERHEIVDEQARAGVMAAVREALTEDAPISPQLTSLIALISSTGLVDRMVAREDRGSARKRARAIASANPACNAVSRAAADVQAAVMAGVIAAIAASSVTGSSGGGHGH